MIEVTRLNGKAFIINADLIRTIEEKPDTIITLTNGDHFVIRETMREVVQRAIEYGRHLRQMFPPT